MSVVAPESVERLGEVLGRADVAAAPVQPSPVEAAGPADEEEREVNATLVCVAALLATAAAGWAAGGAFRGTSPRFVGIGAAVLGVGIVAASFRFRRATIVQHAAVPAALIGGAVLVVPDAQGGTGNLPGLVVEALRSGGIAQPPVPFDPGWRFMLFVLISLLGTASAVLAVGLQRPKIASFLPLPLVMLALLFQPPGFQFAPTAVTLVLVVSCIGVTFGVDMAREGATSGRFELRRVARGLGLVAALVALLFGITQLGFLFPEDQTSQVVPPRRPPPPPPQPDRVIFTVKADRQLPWRLGVLDVYDGRGFLTPPFDPKRLLPVPPGGEVPVVDPAKVPGATGPVEGGTPVDDKAAVEATFTVKDVEGRTLPAVANPQRVVRDGGFAVDVDPRTQALRLPDGRARRGQTYTVSTPIPPATAELSSAGPAPRSFAPFLEVPPAPPGVSGLLATAPTVNGFERLQFLRNALYEKVVASGPGNPVDVPPDRVDQMLAGEPASPFEISAAEVLLARWAGVPARLGYGYYQGDPSSDDPSVIEIRPRHGRTWVEAYFDGYGWVPIVGTPPKAASSLNGGEKQKDRTIRPADELNLVVYVPVQLDTLQLLYVLIRYWLSRTLPWFMGAGLLYWLFPGVLKMVRTARRRSWGSRHGPRASIAVAYAELRDRAADLNVEMRTASPLEFLGALEPDEVHDELAWLVTRVMWGDLSRDVRTEDAAVADQLARSLGSRLRRAQPPLTQLLGFASRKSLRDPYSGEMPNLWYQPMLRARLARWLRARLRRSGSAVRGRRLRSRGPAPAGVMLLALLLLTGCARQVDLETKGPSPLPDKIVEEQVDDVTFRRDEESERAYVEGGPKSLVNTGRVYIASKGPNVVGALEVAAFKPGVLSRKAKVRAGVLQGIGSGRFSLTRIGRERIYTLTLPEQQMFLWFPPSGEYFELFIAKQDFENAAEVFVRILAEQRGERPATVRIDPRPDPRRGSAG